MSAQQKWSAPFCGCGDDMCTCCLVWCLPCVAFGQIAEVLDEGEISCYTHGCIFGVLMTCSIQWVYSCLYRKKLRHKFGLPAEPCSDCCVHCCCEACALCQEHAELKNRGLDPFKGWIRPPNAPPPMPPSMHK